MAEAEGVIKFTLNYQREALDGTFAASVQLLNHWRDILARLELIGADPDRYDGFGFGNLSARCDGNQFLITGSQTGNRSLLTISDYALVTDYQLSGNRIAARGETPPSSESLSHAAVYEADPLIKFVFHVHSPAIWRRVSVSAGAKMSSIPARIAYGTVEMAKAVSLLVKQQWARHKQKPETDASLFVMLGHEDGVIAYGTDADSVGLLLVESLDTALIAND